MKEFFLKIDQEVFLFLNGDLGNTADTIFWALSAKAAFVPVALLALWLIYKRVSIKGFLLSIIFIALVITFCDQISTMFKYLTPKFRPTHNPLLEGLVHTVNGYVGGLYGTVSSHAANSFGVAMFSSLIIKSKPYSWFIFIFSVLVALSRIYLGVHFPLDLIFGTLMGLSFGYILYRLYAYIVKRYEL